MTGSTSCFCTTTAGWPHTREAVRSGRATGFEVARELDLDEP